MKLTEDILHYVWKYRLYQANQLKTLSGKSLDVRSPGIHNRHAGPDFEQARLFIDGVEWAGNVEIHVKSSDWRKHQHQDDPTYNNVVLHVVYEFDEEISLHDGTVPETFVVSAYLPKTFLGHYARFLAKEDWLLCRAHLQNIEPFKISHWLSRIGVERLEAKAREVGQLLDEVKGDWEQLTYILLAKNFGFKTNALPFEQMAKSLPYKLLLKHKDETLAIDALIFGQSGFLENTCFTEAYPKTLQKRYRQFQLQYGLKPINRASWKFLKMRPLNFPTIRLGQFAAWCKGGSHLFSFIIDMPTVDELRSLFSRLPFNTYWCDHYRFEVPAKVKHSAGLGEASVTNIILNTAVIILFSYGKYIGKELYICHAVSLLEQLRAEKNHIVQKYQAAGIAVNTAADSQALLQLKQKYCDHKHCLDCGIGLEIFKQNTRL